MKKKRDNPDFTMQARLAQAITEMIAARMHGLGPLVQGAVLLQLEAIWLSGHTAAQGGKEATQKAREEIWHDHVSHMWKMVASLDEEGERQAASEAEAGTQ